MSSSIEEYIASGLHIQRDDAACAYPSVFGSFWLTRPSEPELIAPGIRCRARAHGLEHWMMGSILAGVLSLAPEADAIPQKRSETLAEVAQKRLSSVKGVEAAFLTGEGDERSIIVAAEEHGIVERSLLIDIEEELSDRFGFVEIRVRAHQGRGVESIAVGEQLF